MDIKIMMILAAMLLASNRYGCSSSTKPQAAQPQNQNTLSAKENIPENNADLIQKKTVTKVGMPNPASGYCYALGYKMKSLKTDKGELGICIFPDGSTCEEWDFYRGLCGQQWSYAALCGYDQKDNGRNGWIAGAICVDKKTGKEIGTNHTLVVDRYSEGYTFPELKGAKK
jgi:putative hemolysin